MLILSRKQNEQITIGENILVTVLTVRGNHVRLGIEAPRSIAVNRDEMVHTSKRKQAGNGGTVQLPLPFPDE